MQPCCGESSNYVFNSTLGCLSVVWENSVTIFPRYLVQSKCSTTNMNTHSQSANPPSQPLFSPETFEELMEISQVPHEKEVAFLGLKPNFRNS